APAQGPRPEQFKFPPLDFKPPKPAEFRATLSNGLVVYIAEDHEIPWFEATLLTPVAGGGRGGGRGRGVEATHNRPQGPPGGGGGTRSFLEPKDKLGIQNITGSVMRSGGTTTMVPEQINERLEFLAGTVSPTSLSIHMRHVDEGLKVWLDILTNPAFPEDRIRRERESMIMPLRNRNRNVTTVATRTFQELIYGEDSPITAEPTEVTIGSITRDDAVAWHKKYWGANNAVLVVAGDFKKADMLQKLEATFGKWRNADVKAVPNYPKVAGLASRGGVYMVQPEGVTPNQGIVRVGFLGLTQDDPDYAAVDLMNYTLGGGSFSSRITQVVRTDNGLAYTANSSVGAGLHYPGAMAAFVQTKNSTVVFATQLMINEIERMRAGDVTEKDLRFAKTARVRAFPSMFSTIIRNIRNFAELEFEQRPMDYYDTYLARYEKVTLADVKRVAQKYLQTDKMLIVVAGNIEECRVGADKMLPNQATIDAMATKYGGRTIDGLAKKFGDGTVHVVKLK
ncbi:MAG: insulinase family protein, partial [Acidobacteria bacterium]|nr:insulinase family protein [Acidobacteriota bacterium]